ncbi:hypothetical protein BXO88_05305 [Oribacterium sp. C9]|uniref:zinc ribbon domain-containing protein n=1 Tax=Oribacterium sp. C9 TaxID=1943579 RepID=UPI00098EDC2D|nr:zinc ribbon domain-containing protein [Oribacterium sp. C9]OON86961.1 hypothetical protein BXO88_05305 [Oribacterium sp. C9]
MAGFCRKCGSPLGKDAMFCTNCGTRIVSIQKKQPVQKQEQQPKMQCRNCGNPIKDGAMFCQKCGIRVIEQQAFEARKEQRNYEQTSAINNGQSQQSIIQNKAVQYAKQQFVQPMIQPVFSDAADSAGETTKQLPQIQSALGFSDEAKAVLDPFPQFFTGVSGFFKGIISIFRAPKALTFSAVLSFVWMILIAMKQFGIGGVFTDALSWITFAQGGLGDGIGGILGGLFGKVVVASGFFALMDGGKDIGEGMKKWFYCFNGYPNIGAILTGAGLSLILYNFFVANASFGDTMVAITGVILAFKALGSQNGFIFGMARSLMAKKLGNSRIPNDSKVNAFISGIGLGSALAIPLSVLPFGYIPYIIGSLIFMIGIILNFTMRGKEEQTV